MDGTPRRRGLTPYQRAAAIIDRAMPDRLAVRTRQRTGPRWLMVDVTHWKKTLARRFAPRLRSPR